MVFTDFPIVFPLNNVIFQDHTNSLLKDLPKDDCKELLKHKKDKEDVSDDEDEINYEKLRQLLKIEDAPEYMQHNRFILSGYRGILPSKLCIERY